jgi:predicted SAM-dependent methyltransferase
VSAARAPRKRALKAVKAPELLKLDLACGQRRTEGFTGVDIAGSPDVKADLLHPPWPFDESSVGEVACAHFAEHIPHEVGVDGKDGWFVFFDELWRVCAPDALCTFVHPYVMHGRAFWDPTHVRYIHEMHWYYLDKQWREAQLLDHYNTVSDFEVVVVSGEGLDADYQSRAPEVQERLRMREWNWIPDLRVTLKARKG